MLHAGCARPCGGGGGSRQIDRQHVDARMDKWLGRAACVAVCCTHRIQLISADAAHSIVQRVRTGLVCCTHEPGTSPHRQVAGHQPLLWSENFLSSAFNSSAETIPSPVLSTCPIPHTSSATQPTLRRGQRQGRKGSWESSTAQGGAGALALTARMTSSMSCTDSFADSDTFGRRSVTTTATPRRSVRPSVASCARQIHRTRRV